MYINKTSGATISNSDFDKLPNGSRIKSKYTKIAEETKSSTPKKSTEKKDDSKL